MFYKIRRELLSFKLCALACTLLSMPVAAFNFDFWNKEEQPKQVRNWHDMLGWTQVKDAAYYQLHSKSGCSCVKARNAKPTLTCKVCKIQTIKDALLKDTCEAIATYHNQDGTIIAFEELDQAPKTPTYVQCEKRLDEKAKFRVVKAVIVYHIKINRAIFLYDHEGDVVYWTRWDNGVALQDVQSDPGLQINVDLSKLEVVEDKYQVPLLIRLLGLF